MWHMKGVWDPRYFCVYNLVDTVLETLYTIVNDDNDVQEPKRAQMTVIWALGYIFFGLFSRISMHIVSHII